MIVNLLQLNFPTELKVDPGLNAAHYNVVYQAIELIVALAIASNYSPQTPGPCQLNKELWM